MTIIQATESNYTAWDTYVLAHPQGNPYLLSAWSRAIAKAYRHRVYALLAEAAGRIVGVLPLVHIRHPLFGNTLFSMPYADLGGLLADDDKAATALLDEAARIAAGECIPTIELRQQTPLQDGGAAKLHRSDAGIDKVRMVLELPDSVETLMAGFKAKLRSQIRRPQKEGLEIRTGGVELLEDFYRVFAENMRDLGSPVHGRNFIAAVLNGFEGRGRVHLVHRAGEVYAAGITLVCGSTVFNPWSSSLRRHSAASPNMLLYWAMLSDACEQGARCFDLGRSTPGAGTHRFKQQWGAMEQPLHWQTLSTRRPEMDSAGGEMPSRQRAEQLWRRLPVAVSRVLGPPLRKYIGL